LDNLFESRKMISKAKMPDKSVILQAHDRIRQYINLTPVLTSVKVNDRSAAQLFFKCENFQKVGAFKFRGALNAVLSIPKSNLQAGVATHSSGNHAQALSLAAQIMGIPAHVVMPDNSPQVKIRAVKSYGGRITFCKATLKDREETLARVVKKTGAAFIHPYNDYNIIAGQATAAKELVKETDELDFILAPVGGGGLLSGTALSTYYFAEKTKVIGCEPENADDAQQSFKAGKIIPSLNPQTIADGLKTSLGDKTFPIIKEYVDDILTVSEEDIVEAMIFIWERMKIIIEPSSAVPVAVLFKYKTRFINRRVGIIISGGNVDLRKLPWQ